MQLSQQPNILLGDDSDQTSKDISCSRPQRTKRPINRLQVGLAPQSHPPVSSQSSPQPVVMLQKHKNGSLMAKKLQLMERGIRKEKREHKNDAKPTPYRYKNQCFKKTKIEYRDEKVENDDNDSKNEKLANKTYPSMVTYDSDCDDWYRPWPPVTARSPSAELDIGDKRSSEVLPQEPRELVKDIGGSGIENTLVVPVKKRFRSVSFSHLTREENSNSSNKLEADVNMYGKESPFKESVKLTGKTKVNKESSRVSGVDKAMGPLGDKVSRSETVSRKESFIPRREKDTVLLEAGVETSQISSPQESSKFIVIGDRTMTDEIEAMGNNNNKLCFKEPSIHARSNEKIGSLEDGENNCRTVLSKEASKKNGFHDNEGSLKAGVNDNGQNYDKRIDPSKDDKNNILPGSHQQDTTLAQDDTNKKRRYITNWMPFLKRKKLYIEGDLLNVGDTPTAPPDSSSRYFTSRIVSRISEREVASKKTVYVLEGPLTIPEQDARLMPRFMIDKFNHGFPEDWKMAVDNWKASA